MAENDTEKTTPKKSTAAGAKQSPAKSSTAGKKAATAKKAGNAVSKKKAETDSAAGKPESAPKVKSSSASKSSGTAKISKATKSSGTAKASSAAKSGTSRSGTALKAKTGTSRSSGTSKTASGSGTSAKAKTTGTGKASASKSSGTAKTSKATKSSGTAKASKATKSSGTAKASKATKSSGTAKASSAAKSGTSRSGTSKTAGASGRSTSSRSRKAGQSAGQAGAITEPKSEPGAEPVTGLIFDERVQPGEAFAELSPEASEAAVDAHDAGGHKDAASAPEPESETEPVKAAARSAETAAAPISEPYVSEHSASKPRKRFLNGAAILSAAILPIVLLYHEIVFRVATLGPDIKASLIPTFLFCVIYGLAGSLLTGITKKPGFNRGAKIALMLAGIVLFSIEYFIYREFKVFYDLKTVTSGAGGVVSGFMDQVYDLIFSPGGIRFLVLTFLPLILYCVFGRRIDKAGPLGVKGIAALLITAAVAVGLNAAVINAVDLYKYAYGSRYTFQGAVEKFGFMTGLRLDASRGAGNRGPTDYGEENADSSADTEEQPEFLHVTVSNVTKTAAQGKLVYDKNALNIDFEALGNAAGGALQAMDIYVSRQEPTSQNEMTGLFAGKNLIFISAEAFSAEVIDPVRTPTLYRLATKGINFTDYYQPASAGTTGGEFENIFGMLPMSGGASMGEMTDNLCWYTMSYQLNMLGYYGVAYHNNDYMYYNRHITHNKLGYSQGFYGLGNGLEKGITEQWPESDLEMMEATVDAYIDHRPFNVYYMSVSGHSGYSYDGNAMTRKNWDSTAGYEGSDTVRAYLACNVELDKAMEYLVKRLEEKGIADDTVIVISADHFPYGLETDASLGNMPYLSELYGYNVETMMQRDHNRLILWSGCLEKEEEPIVIDTPTFSLDILPTLLNLYGIPFDSRVLVGRDVFSKREALVFNLNHDWKTERGTYEAWTDTFTPAGNAADIPSDYVSRMNTIVANKINYCSDVITYDYYRHLFG